MVQPETSLSRSAGEGHDEVRSRRGWFVVRRASVSSQSQLAVGEQQTSLDLLTQVAHAVPPPPPPSECYCTLTDVLSFASCVFDCHEPEHDDVREHWYFDHSWAGILRVEGRAGQNDIGEAGLLILRCRLTVARRGSRSDELALRHHSRTTSARTDACVYHDERVHFTRHHPRNLYRLAAGPHLHRASKHYTACISRATVYNVPRPLMLE